MQIVKKLIFCLLLIGTSSLLLQCSAQEPAAKETTSGLAGTWDNGTYRVVLATNSSYSASLSAAPGATVVMGTYTVLDSQISLIDTWGVPYPSGGSYACDSSNVGIYAFTKTSTTLDLTLVSDPCPGRIAGVSAPFTKL